MNVFVVIRPDGTRTVVRTRFISTEDIAEAIGSRRISLVTSLKSNALIAMDDDGVLGSGEKNELATRLMDDLGFPYPAIQDYVLGTIVVVSRYDKRAYSYSSLDVETVDYIESLTTPKV
jgi:hypothetical protein